MRLNNPGSSLLLSRSLSFLFFLFGCTWTHEINVLLEDSPDYQRQRGKGQVVASDIDIIEDGLPREPAVKSKYELRNCKEHVLVEEVKNHLSNPDVIPPAMHQQQPPQHPKLRQRIVTRLHSSHPFLPEQPHPDMCSLDHRYIIRPVPDRQCYLIQVCSHYTYYLGLLDGEKTATNHSIAVLGQIRELLLAILVTDYGCQVCPLDQETFGLTHTVKFLSPFSQSLESVQYIGRILALVPQDLKVRLYQVATFGNILSSLHLIPGQHPHLNLYITTFLLARIKSLIV